MITFVALLAAGCGSDPSANEALPERVSVQSGVLDSNWIEVAQAAVIRHGEQPSEQSRRDLDAVVAAADGLLVAGVLEGRPVSLAPVTSRLAAVGLADGRLLLVDGVSGKHELLAEFDGEVLVAVDQSRGPETDLVVHAEGAIWRVELGCSDPTSPVAAQGASTLSAVAGRGRVGGGNVVAFDRDGTSVVMVDAESGAELAVLDVGGPVRGLAVSSWTSDVFVATPTAVRRYIRNLVGGWDLGWEASVVGAHGLALRPDGSAVTVWGARGAERSTCYRQPLLDSSRHVGVGGLHTRRLPLRERRQHAPMAIDTLLGDGWVSTRATRRAPLRQPMIEPRGVALIPRVPHPSVRGDLTPTPPRLAGTAAARTLAPMARRPEPPDLSEQGCPIGHPRSWRRELC